MDELMVYLEQSMDMSSMEQGMKLVGATLVNMNLNKWGSGIFYDLLGENLGR